MSWPECFGSGFQLDETTKDGDGFSILVPSNRPICAFLKGTDHPVQHSAGNLGTNTLTGGS